MMQNKKVIVFRKFAMVFFPANLGKWRIWRSLCAPQVGWFGSDYHPKKTPFNTLSNEPSFVALSLLITKRLAFELLGFQLTQLFPGQNYRLLTLSLSAFPAEGVQNWPTCWSYGQFHP